MQGNFSSIQTRHVLLFPPWALINSVFVETNRKDQNVPKFVRSSFTCEGVRFAFIAPLKKYRENTVSLMCQIGEKGKRRNAKKEERKGKRTRKKAIKIGEGTYQKCAPQRSLQGVDVYRVFLSEGGDSFHEFHRGLSTKKLENAIQKSSKLLLVESIQHLYFRKQTFIRCAWIFVGC